MAKAAGWVIAVVAVGVAVALAMHSARTASEFEDAEEEIQSLRAEVSTLQAAAEQSAQDSVQERSTLEARLEEATGHIAKLEAEATRASLTQAAAGLHGTGANKEDQRKDRGRAGFGQILEEMNKNPKMKAAQSKMMVNMQYAKLFNGLQLPPEVGGQVRDIVGKYMLEQLEQGMAAFGGDQSSMKEMRSKSDTITERMLRELSAVLTPEELATWEEYEANKDQHMLEQTYESQMGMFAPELTQENRQLIASVLAEEVASGQAEQANSDEPFTFSGQLDVQTAAFERAQYRLSEVLDETQYGHSERFLDQMLTTMEASFQMMDSMRGPDEESPEE